MGDFGYAPLSQAAEVVARARALAAQGEVSKAKRLLEHYLLTAAAAGEEGTSPEMLSADDLPSRLSSSHPEAWDLLNELNG